MYIIRIIQNPLEIDPTPITAIFLMPVSPLSKKPPLSSSSYIDSNHPQSFLHPSNEYKKPRRICNVVSLRSHKNRHRCIGIHAVSLQRLIKIWIIGEDRRLSAFQTRDRKLPGQFGEDSNDWCWSFWIGRCPRGVSRDP